MNEFLKCFPGQRSLWAGRYMAKEEREYEQLHIQVSKRLKAKLERMRQGSKRPSIQNTVEAALELTDETAPEWNIVPQKQETANDEPIAG